MRITRGTVLYEYEYRYQGPGRGDVSSRSGIISIQSRFSANQPRISAPTASSRPRPATTYTGDYRYGGILQNLYVLKCTVQLATARTRTRTSTVGVIWWIFPIFLYCFFVRFRITQCNQM